MSRVGTSMGGLMIRGNGEFRMPTKKVPLRNPVKRYPIQLHALILKMNGETRPFTRIKTP